MACLLTFLMGALVHSVDTDFLGEEGGDSDLLARSVLSATNSLRARGDWKLSGLPAALTSGRGRRGGVVRSKLNRPQVFLKDCALAG